MTAPAAGTRMRWASAVTYDTDAPIASAAIVAQVSESLAGAPVHLLLVFFAGPCIATAEHVLRGLRESLRPECLAAVSTNAAISAAHELEGRGAITVLAAHLPDVTLTPVVMVEEVWREAIVDAQGFDAIAPGLRGAELVLLFADPFSFDIERTLSTFATHAPGLRVAGGMANGVPRAGQNVLALNDWYAHEGAIAIGLHGAIRADVFVSQGCAPIGPPLDVTHAEDNMLLTLDGQPALERIERVLQELPERERERLRNGLYIGRPVRGEASGRGDYRIRNLLGADRERGAVGVADLMKAREKIRLHVRDAQTAIEDLEMLLMPQAFDVRAQAALLFACNGRGRQFFGAADRDIATLESALGGGVPAAGMFCAGEIGPVGERTYLHGHAASIAILRDAR